MFSVSLHISGSDCEIVTIIDWKDNEATKEVGEEIVSTNIRPFYVEGYGFERADAIIAGEKLLNSAGNPVEVEKVETVNLAASVKVYNLEVEDWHTYYVMEEGILVHNMCAVGETRLRKNNKDSSWP